MPLDTTERLSRRSMIRAFAVVGGSALLAACSSAAPTSPTSAPAKPTDVPKPAGSPPAVAASPAAQPAASPAAAASGISDADWAKVVDAARQERTVAVATYSGTGYRKIVEDFQAAYPGITVEQTQFQSSSRDFMPRLLQEFKAGLKTWDLAFMPNAEMLRQGRPAGALEPIRPLIVKSDVLDDKTWLDGSFNAGWIDQEQKWGYAISLFRSESVWINTDSVKDGEIKSVTDMYDPKWKGKIVAGDPRTKGSGFWSATVMRIKTGSDDVITKLYKDQEPLLSVDARQLTEAMVRGRYVIGVGAVDRVIVEDFRSQGLGSNIKSIAVPDIDYLNSSNHVGWLLKDAPHPNAAKVFMNWVLSTQGAASFAENGRANSRRADVKVFDENTRATGARDYVRIDDERLMDEIETTQKIAKDILN